MKDLRAQHDLTPLVIHDSYLINLAAPPPSVRGKSIETFRGEIERALIIGADFFGNSSRQLQRPERRTGHSERSRRHGACLARREGGAQDEAETHDMSKTRLGRARS